MKLHDVIQRVNEILASDDTEAAHSLDDVLREEFLRACATGALTRKSAQRIAQELLRTANITRRYA